MSDPGYHQEPPPDIPFPNVNQQQQRRYDQPAQPPSVPPVHARFLQNLSSLLPSPRATEPISAYLAGHARIVLDDPTSAVHQSSCFPHSAPAPPEPLSFGETTETRGFASYVNGEQTNESAGSMVWGRQEGGVEGEQQIDARQVEALILRSQEEVQQMRRQAYASQQRQHLQEQLMSHYQQHLPRPSQQPSHSLQSWPNPSFYHSQQPPSGFPPLPPPHQQAHQNQYGQQTQPFSSQNTMSNPSRFPISFSLFPNPSQPPQYNFLPHQAQSHHIQDTQSYNFSPYADPSIPRLDDQVRFVRPSFDSSINGDLTGDGAWPGAEGATGAGGPRGASQNGMDNRFGYRQQQQQQHQQGQMEMGPETGMIVGGSPVDESFSHRRFSNPAYLPSSTSYDAPNDRGLLQSSSGRRSMASKRPISSDGSYVEGGSSNNKTAGPATAAANDDGKRKHVCQICNRSFARAYNLKAHHATHDPARVKPHKCPHPTCNRAFSRSHDLERHRMGIHGDGPLSIKGGGIPSNYACKQNGGKPSTFSRAQASAASRARSRRAVRGVSQTPSSSSSTAAVPPVLARAPPSRRQPTRNSQGRGAVDDLDVDSDGEEEDLEEDGDYVA